MTADLPAAAAAYLARRRARGYLLPDDETELASFAQTMHAGGVDRTPSTM